MLNANYVVQIPSWDWHNFDTYYTFHREDQMGRIPFRASSYRYRLSFGAIHLLFGAYFNRVLTAVFKYLVELR